MKLFEISVTVAALAMAAQPALAASDLLDGSGASYRSAGFIGVRTQMLLGQRKAKAPTARLVAGMTRYAFEDRSGRTIGMVRAPGLELGFDRTGKMVPYVAGQSMPEMEKRLGVRGSTGKTLLIIGGVAAAAGLAYFLFRDDRCIYVDEPCN
jgi:hypothetical protein